MWLERTSTTELPAPTGPFAVGRAIFEWRDEATVDPLAPEPGTKREVLVWLWYPATPAPSAAAGDYIPDYMLAAAGPMRGPMRFVTRDASKVRPHSSHDVTVSPRQPSYPIVIFRGGASLTCPPTRRSWRTLRATFNDDGAILKSRLMRGMMHFFGKLKINGRRQLEITAYCARTFFDAYLKQTGARPAIASPSYPELEVLE